MQTTSETSPLFLKIRAIAFAVVSFAALLWIVALSVILFTQWEVFGSSEKSLVLLMLVSHSTTAVILLVLLILHFRPWLDAARVLLLLIFQFGPACAFAYWYPRFQCSPDRIESCQLIIGHILILSWVVPFLLLGYTFGLGLLVWKQATSPSSPSSASTSLIAPTVYDTTSDVEKAPEATSSGPSALSIVPPNRLTQLTSYVDSPISIAPPHRHHASLSQADVPESASAIANWRPPILFVDRPNSNRYTMQNSSTHASAHHERFLDIFATASLYNFSPHRRQTFDLEEISRRRGSTLPAAGVQRTRRLSKPAPIVIR